MTFLRDIVHGALVGSVQLAQLFVPGPSVLGNRLGLQARKADPVVLVGGFATSPNLWDAWVRSLRADGFDVHVVEVPEHGLGDMRTAVAAVKDAVEAVRLLRPGRKVDIVGFSEGGVLARMYVAHHGGASAVDSIVTVASPHNGLTYGGVLQFLSRLPLIGPTMPEAAMQLIQGSDLMRNLAAAERALGTRVPVTSIYANMFDGIVSPSMSALHTAVRNRSAGTANHLTIVRSSRSAYELARAALLATR